MAHEVCNSLQHTARLEDKGREDDPAQVGAGPQLRDDVHENIALVGLDNSSVVIADAFVIGDRVGAGTSIGYAPTTGTAHKAEHGGGSRDECRGLERGRSRVVSRGSRLLLEGVGPARW